MTKPRTARRGGARHVRRPIILRALYKIDGIFKSAPYRNPGLKDIFLLQAYLLVFKLEKNNERHIQPQTSLRADK
jgi:hypothetical protein